MTAADESRRTRSARSPCAPYARPTSPLTRRGFRRPARPRPWAGGPRRRPVRSSMTIPLAGRVEQLERIVNAHPRRSRRRTRRRTAAAIVIVGPAALSDGAAELPDFGVGVAAAPVGTTSAASRSQIRKPAAPFRSPVADDPGQAQAIVVLSRSRRTGVRLAAIPDGSAWRRRARTRRRRPDGRVLRAPLTRAEGFDRIVDGDRPWPRLGWAGRGPLEDLQPTDEAAAPSCPDGSARLPVTSTRVPRTGRAFRPPSTTIAAVDPPIREQRRVPSRRSRWRRSRLRGGSSRSPAPRRSAACSRPGLGRRRRTRPASASASGSGSATRRSAAAMGCSVSLDTGVGHGACRSASAMERRVDGQLAAQRRRGTS